MTRFAIVRHSIAIVGEALSGGILLLGCANRKTGVIDAVAGEQAPGDPRILVEHVAPIPTAVDAPIQVVWPKDASGTSANITGVLLAPNTTNPVPCRWNPTVRLFASVDGGPTTLMGTASKRTVNDNGLTYPAWDFNSVDISAVNQGKSIDFWMDVATAGVVTHAARWTYAADQPWPPFWQQQPTASCR